MLLPEAAFQDADAVYRRLAPAIQPEVGLLAAGMAELEPRDDPLSLLERAEAALTGGDSAAAV